MPRKFSEVYNGPPSWLDVSREKDKERGYKKRTKVEFISESFEVLLKKGLSVWQAQQITANSCIECGYGESLYWENAGGWKIKKSYVDAYREVFGKCPYWFRSEGNIDSGDDPWCFYRVFTSLEFFYSEWIDYFVSAKNTSDRYYQCSKLFSAEDEQWISYLILAGYKGNRSQKKLEELRENHRPDHYHPSIQKHRLVCNSIIKYWIQSKIGVTPDGDWGEESKNKWKEILRSKNEAVYPDSFDGELNLQDIEAYLM